MLHLFAVAVDRLLPNLPSRPVHWDLLARHTDHFRSRPPHSRAPAASVKDHQQLLPAQPGTGGTGSTRATGKVAAELRVVKRTSMLAGLMRPAACNHRFPTHAAHTGSIISSSLTAAFHCSPTNHDLLPRGTNRTISSHLLAQLAAPALPFWPSLARHEP